MATMYMMYYCTHDKWGHTHQHTNGHRAIIGPAGCMQPAGKISLKPHNTNLK